MQLWLSSRSDGRKEDGREVYDVGDGDGRDCPPYGETVDDVIQGFGELFNSLGVGM